MPVTQTHIVMYIMNDATIPYTDIHKDAADVGSRTAVGTADHVGDNDLFTKLFEEIYDHYQKGHMTEEIDQSRAKLALTIPE